MVSTTRRMVITSASALALHVRTPAWAQKTAKKRVGFLSSYTREAGTELGGCFRKGLANFGWAEGTDLEFEYRWADGRVDRLVPLAEELNGLEDMIGASAAGINSTQRRRCRLMALSGH